MFVVERADERQYEDAGYALLAASPSVVTVFRDYCDFVRRALQQLRVQRCDLEDAFQEVFVVVYRRLADYRHCYKLKAWLYAICIRVARNFRRKHYRLREELTPNPPDAVIETCQIEHMARRQALRLAKHWLLLLPESQRTVFLLYEVQQLPMSEVAAVVNCPLQTAYSRLKSARERLLLMAARTQRGGHVL